MGRKIALPGAGALVLALATVATAQQSPGLTPMDYVQIRQLAARYAFAMDTGADDGYQLADLFATDGELVNPSAKGRDELAVVARGGNRGPLNTSLYTMNHVIEPAPEGAIGRQYIIQLNFDQNVPQVPPGTSQWSLIGQKRGEVSNLGGHFQDVYVKTAQGWRFKRRELITSRSGPQPQIERLTGTTPTRPVSAPSTASASTDGGGLTVMDYLQIEALEASYGHALDNGYGTTDNGVTYRNLYTPDADFVGRTGHAALEQLGREQPHGPKYARHFLTNHVIEPTPTGAKGKAYLAVIDIGEGNAPSTLFLGGHYEVEYVKTPDGWRIQNRRLYAPRFGPQSSASAR